MKNRLMSVVIASALAMIPVQGIFVESTVAQSTDGQAEQQARRAILNELRKNTNFPATSWRVSRLFLLGNYAYGYWEQGPGGGAVVAIKRQRVWQAIIHGDDYEGIARLLKDGIPRSVAERLLDKADPNWRNFEPQGETSKASQVSCDVVNIRTGQLALRFTPGGESRAGLDNGNIVQWLGGSSGVWRYVRVINGPNSAVNGLSGWVNSNYLSCYD